MVNTFVDFGESNGHKCFPKLGLMSKDLARFDEKKVFIFYFISNKTIGQNSSNPINIHKHPVGNIAKFYCFSE